MPPGGTVEQQRMSSEEHGNLLVSQHVAVHLAATAAAGHPGLGDHTAASGVQGLAVAAAAAAIDNSSAPDHLAAHLDAHHAALGISAPHLELGEMTKSDTVATFPAGTVATVSDLVIYPLKSGAGISVKRAELTPRGLRWDRCWCVMDAEGFVQDQRVKPMLSMVMPRVENGDTLVLTAPAETALPPLLLPLDEDAYTDLDGGEVSDRHNHKWFGKPLLARYAGDAAAEWITNFCTYYDQLWSASNTPPQHSPLSKDCRLTQPMQRADCLEPSLASWL